MCIKCNITFSYSESQRKQNGTRENKKVHKISPKLELKSDFLLANNNNSSLNEVGDAYSEQ